MLFLYNMIVSLEFLKRTVKLTTLLISLLASAGYHFNACNDWILVRSNSVLKKRIPQTTAVTFSGLKQKHQDAAHISKYTS